MMGAASLPNSQAAAPAGFAAFLSTIGQTPGGGGESGGFDQVLAAMPVPAAAPVKAATIPVAGNSTAAPPVPVPVAVPTPVGARVAAAIGAISATATPNPAATTTAPVVTAKAVESDTPVVPADPDAAAATAAQLLIAVNGQTPAPQPKITKPGETKADADAATDGVPDTTARAPVTQAAETAAPVIATVADPAAPATAAVVAIPVVATIIAPVVGKPAKPAETAAIPTDAAAPAADLPTAAPVPGKAHVADATPDVAPSDAAPVVGKSAAAPPTRPMTAAASEAPPVKIADAAPSMTIQFAQPIAPGIAMTANMTQPVTVAEQMLDLTSDGAWIDQLAHDITATQSDSGDISFRLMPRHLGRLDVAMLMREDGVSLKLDTQHEAAATIVTAAQGRLVEDLRQQGVRVTGSEVTCTPNDTGRQMQGQSQGQGRAAAQDVSHLIETVAERVKARDPEEAADRRGRFA